MLHKIEVSLAEKSNIASHEGVTMNKGRVRTMLWPIEARNQIFTFTAGIQLCTTHSLTYTLLRLSNLQDIPGTVLPVF